MLWLYEKQSKILKVELQNCNHKNFLFVRWKYYNGVIKFFSFLIFWLGCLEDDAFKEKFCWKKL